MERPLRGTDAVPQHDNRNGEPNLHVHKVLLNRAVRDDRATSRDVKWRALYGKALWDEQLGLGACDRPCHPWRSDRDGRRVRRRRFRREQLKSQERLGSWLGA